MNIKKILIILFLLFGFSYLHAGAVDDDFTTNAGQNLTANVLNNDSGSGKKVTNYWDLSCGKIESFYINGKFTYSPKNCTGDVTFRYKMKYKYYYWGSYYYWVYRNAKVTIHIKNNNNGVNKNFPYTDLDVNKDFYQLYNSSVYGDFVATGNTIMDGNKNTQYFAGSTPTMIHDDNALDRMATNIVDEHTNNKNSSSAPLKLPSYVKAKDIVWAGLFWQGQIHSGATNSNIVNQKIKDWNRVLLKTPNGQIHEIIADKSVKTIDNSTYHYLYAKEKQFRMHYSAYVNVTDIVKNSGYTSSNNTFTVGNILATDGKDNGSWMYFNHINEPEGEWYKLHMGHYGGWSLIVIYNVKNDFANDVPLRNVSIFNGFDLFSFWSADEYGNTNVGDEFKTVINISGFRTPSNGGISSKMLFFGGAGDYGMGGDTFAIQDKKDTNTFVDLSNSKNSGDQKFNGTYTKFGENIIDGKDYFQGMDLDIYNTSSMMDHNQSSTSLKFGVVQHKSYIDQVFPQVVAFSTELYAPKVCYDYDIKLGDYYSVPTDDKRNFTVKEYGNYPLKLNILIRSEDADFDLIHSKAYIKFTPDDKLEFNSSKYTPPNTYAYEDSIIIDQDKGIVAVGKNPTNSGGTISANERMYYKFYYNFKDENYFKGKFDLYLDANISFDGVHQTNYLLSTNADPKSKRYIPRCDTNPKYDPVYGIFNAERGDSTFKQDEAQRYSLKTQVAGVPYKISIATYKKDSNGKYTIPNNNIHTDVEVELINAGTMENNSSSGFDSVCQNPESYNRGAFVSFNGDTRKTINIPEDYPTYPSNLALRNAAFRVWVLTKEINGTKEIVKYHCNSSSNPISGMFNFPYVRNACYKALYSAVYAPYEAKDLKAKCAVDCASDIDPNGNGCYDCLRKYYAMPFCSRDNFAIRPYTYDVKLFDNNESNIINPMEIGSNSTPKINNIAAGYKYEVKTKAIGYGDDNLIARGYNFLDANASNLKSSEALFQANSGASCNDRSNKYVNIVIFNGESTKQYYDDNNNSGSILYSSQNESADGIDNNNSTYDNTLLLDNVGKYKFAIIDKEWTLVDQKGFEYKPFPNIADCELNSTDPKASNKAGVLRGCDIKSNMDPKVDLTIISHPYKFNLSSIDVISRTGSNYVYINDINKTKSAYADNSIMALNIRGDIKALGKDGKVLTNYKKGCVAQDLDINLQYTQDLNQSFYLRPLNIKYALYDSSVIQNPQDTNVSIVNSSTNPNKNINLKLDKKYFYPNSGGLGKFSLYLNYNRRFDDPINPFNFVSKKIEANSTNEKITVNLNSNYYPKGSKDINKTHIFYYVKTKPLSEFYDDIYTDSVNTPVSIALYCGFIDKSKCANYDINTTEDGTDEYDWWYSRKHNSNAGKVLIEFDPNSSTDSNVLSQFVIEPSSGVINKWKRGIAKDVNISKIVDPNDISYPYVVGVKATNEMKLKYPYLLFNSKGVNTPPNILWKNRFVKESDAWSGEGKSGYSVDTNVTGRRNKKMDW